MKETLIDIANISTAVITGLAIIVKATPTKKDDLFLNRYVVRPVNAFCKLIFWWTK